MALVVLCPFGTVDWCRPGIMENHFEAEGTRSVVKDCSSAVAHEEQQQPRTRSPNELIFIYFINAPDKWLSFALPRW